MFMEPELTEYMDWHEIDGDSGTFYYPADMVSMDEAREGYESEFGKVWEEATIRGCGARLSASGYMDATDWAVFDNPKEAIEYLLDMYADGEEDEELYEAILDLADQAGVEINSW